MKFVVGANVLSEPTKAPIDPGVVAWLRQNEAQLVTNPILLGELEYGILLLPPGPKAKSIAAMVYRGRTANWNNGS